MFRRNRQLRRVKDRVLKTIIDLRSGMDSAKRKCEVLGIRLEGEKESKPTGDGEPDSRADEEDEDVDFEQVPMKGGFESHVIGEDGEIDPSDYSFSSAFDVSSSFSVSDNESFSEQTFSDSQEEFSPSPIVIRSEDERRNKRRRLDDEPKVCQ